MYGIKVFVVVSVFLILIPFTGAKIIENPEAVSYLHANLVKEGSILIESTGPLSRATELTVYLSIPQNMNSQTSIIEDVEGPDSFKTQQDSLGNDILKLNWKNPPVGSEIEYAITFDVEVLDKINPAPGKSFKTTDMTKTTLDMTENAYNIVSDFSNTQKILKLTEWVYYWVDYEYEYEGLPKDAKWVYENRRGICSSNSNLLISLLKSLGFNAYYVVGYAYTEEMPGNYWGPHGWVEVEYGGNMMSLDPTWMESPVDGTHIKFANAADSNYTERAEIMGSQVRLVWDRKEPVIDLIDFRESERVQVDAEIIPEEIGGESYALLVTEVSSGVSSDCVLSNMHIQSCSIGNEYFLDIPVKEKTLIFCDSDEILWFMKTPEIRGSTIYTCPVSIYSSGSLKKPQIRARSMSKDVKVMMSTPSVLTPGEIFKVQTTLENHDFSEKNLKVYMILGGIFQSEDVKLSSGYQADLEWSLKAPQTPGDFTIRFFSSSGDLVEKNLTVISKRNVKIESVEIPDNITMEDSIFIRVNIKGFAESIGQIQLKIDDKTQTKDFSISEDETKNFLFPYTPESSGNKEVSVILISDGRYEDGLIGNLLVTKDSEWWEQIVKSISDFIKWLGSLLGI